MLLQKKIYSPEEYEIDIYGKEESERVDFSGVIVNGMQMGFTYPEMLNMRLGEYADFFESYKPIYNMRVEKSTYKIPEKRVSLHDL